jgi:hypothetical protein
MSDPADDLPTYVSKATLHLWGKFKESEALQMRYAQQCISLGQEAKDYADQVKALKEELARVQEDLHRANEVLAKLFKDRQ